MIRPYKKVWVLYEMGREINRVASLLCPVQSKSPEFIFQMEGINPLVLFSILLLYNNNLYLFLPRPLLHAG